MAYCYSCSVVCLLAIQLEAILSNSTRKLLWPETSKRLIAVLFNITFGTLVPYIFCQEPHKKAEPVDVLFGV